jgi:hypothetical protein
MMYMNEEHHVQIKNTHYSCIYLMCIYYFFNETIFFTSLKMGCVAYLVARGTHEKIEYLKLYY